MNRKYNLFKSKMQKLADMHGAMAIMSWDKEVNMPQGGAATRARQLSTLAGLAHEEFTDRSFGTLLLELSRDKSLGDAEKKNVVISLKEYRKSKKFKTEFVMRKSQIVSEVYQAWIKAKAENNYAIFSKPLDKLLDIVRQEADILGYKEHPYDALLDQYEPGLTVKKLDEIFKEVKAKLLPLIAEINQAKQVDNEFLFKKYPKDMQWEYGMYLLECMGYDFNHGRQDKSPHPFTISFSSEDVRVTTRIDENDFANMTWSCIHEGGHALYEQGLNPNEYGMPCGNAASLAIHESQSRLWENNVGRSLDFWKWQYPGLQKYFKKNLKNTGVKEFYKGINRVAPNLIRTEADELHYHIHVMIRYEIEKKIMEGKIKATAIKTLWNKLYKEYMGMDVESDDKGVLQDVHWAHGSIGYFPTYSLGSFYAAQFFHTACDQVTDLKEEIQNGQTSSLLQWLRENIHVHGRRYEANELCKLVTGEELNFEYFYQYAVKKYSKIYRLKKVVV